MTEAAGESPRILVVDDQAGMRLTLRGILTRKGYAVDMAEDGMKALELASRTKYRLILMDIKMPGLSGVEAFIKIKDISPGTTVIMMTAFAMQEEIQRAIREGAYAIVYKPFDMEQVVAIIKECLDGKSLILIVDDEVESALVLKKLFETRGYRVGVVSSGEECLQELSKKHYQVILLDVKMPGIDGLATLRQIKSLRPDVGVIMVTGHSKEDVLQQALREGSFACLPKPLEIESVVQVIDQCLKKERGPAPKDG